MENYNSNVVKMEDNQNMLKCGLCEMVLTSKTHYDTHIDEQHFYIFRDGLNFKEENKEIMNKELPSLDTKRSLNKQEDNEIMNKESPSFETKSSLLNLKISQLNVKSSLSDLESIPLDFKSSHLDFKSSLLDLKWTECEVQDAEKQKLREYQIKQNFDQFLEFEDNKSGNLSEPDEYKYEQFFKLSTKIHLKQSKVLQNKILQCEYCPKIFHHKYHLAIHIRSAHTSENKMTCKICEKKRCWRAFDEKYTETYNGKKEFKCKKCVKILANLDQAIPERVVCTICDESFGSEQSLHLHQLKVHESKNLHCEHCPKFFDRKSNLAQHIRSLHTSEKNMICKICEKKRSWRAFDEKYTETVDGKKEFKCKKCAKILNNFDQANPERVVCTMCDESFGSKPILHLHHLKVHENKNLQCEHCPKFFHRKYHLAIHIRSTHTSENQMTCKICEKKRSWRAFNEKYTETHNGKKEFKCKKCVKILDNLDQTNPERVVCPICDESFGSKPSLYLHELRVHQNKNLQCEHCQKFFPRKYNLAQHIRSLHTSENKMTCQVCEKKLSCRAFNDKYTETIDGKKAFKCKTCVKIEASPDRTKPDRVVCPICKRDYLNSQVLKQHHCYQHIKREKFECQDCAISLASKSSLYNHLKHVHGDKKLQCYPCGKTFSLNMSFKKHNISFHSSNNKEFCFRCQKHLSFRLFSKKNRKWIDGQCVSICIFCHKMNNSEELG